MAPAKRGRGRKGGTGRGRKEGSPPPQKETPKLADVCKCFFACGACGACVLVVLVVLVVMRACIFWEIARGVPQCSLQQEHQQHHQQQGEQQRREQGPVPEEASAAEPEGEEFHDALE
jgi:hypothetical protein